MFCLFIIFIINQKKKLVSGYQKKLIPRDEFLTRGATLVLANSQAL